MLKGPEFAQGGRPAEKERRKLSEKNKAALIETAGDVQTAVVKLGVAFTALQQAHEQLRIEACNLEGDVPASQRLVLQNLSNVLRIDQLSVDLAALMRLHNLGPVLDAGRVSNVINPVTDLSE